MNPWTNRVFVIAEAGVNHNGDMDLALKLIDAAADAGCDAVKFQTFKAHALVTPQAGMAHYQQANTGRAENQLQMLERLELDEDDHRVIFAHAATRKVGVFSTAFDLDSIDLLARHKPPYWKIPSGEITNLPYLRCIGSQALPVMLSTGMATLAEVDQALQVLLEAGLARQMICVLHCNTDYPTPWSDVNLRAMVTMGNALGTTYGYSDHTLGIEVAVAAVALGARVIEKHVTLDRNLPGPDHRASLEPAELAQMVRSIRHIELALGDGIKRPGVAEMANRMAARKSLVAAQCIEAGELFSAQNMTAKRPGNGISPMRWDELAGQCARRAFDRDELISL